MRLIYKRGRERIAFPLDEGETFIGRKDYCDIYFPDGSLSKRHARLVREGGRLLVYDAGSRNGTMVNGEMIDEAELFNGDVLQCGKLRFKVEGMSADGKSYEDFELLSGDATRSQRRGDGRGSGRGSADRGDQVRSVVTARAVTSTETRPSMLDVLPELPPSVERDGADVESEPVRPRAGAILRLVDGGPAETWELTGETMTIGSKGENAVVISGEGVSRYHAEIVLEDGDWLLKDLGARNGVFIAGERIDIHQLKAGDEIQIGTVRLRFELVQPNPLDNLKEVIAGIQQDPVGAFKRDPRLRLGAASILAALILIVMVLPSGAGRSFLGGGGETAHGPWLQEGSTQLLQGNYAEARDVFRKAKVHVAQHSQQVPRTLERVAEQWMTLEQGPLKFRWKKAGDDLAKTAHLKDLPPELREWLDQQVAFVDLNTKAYETLSEAKLFGEQASNLGQREQLEDALNAYAKAIATYDQVSRSSQLGDEATQRSEELRKRAFKLMVDHLQKRIRSPKPDWLGSVQLIGRAREFASSTDEKMILRRLTEECETNRRDEARYVAAVKLIESRILAKYPDAKRLLEEVDRRSRIYPDAQAYIDWIDADLKVRHAKRAYDIGDARQAFLLLSEAMNYEVLGPEAKSSVRQRRDAWLRVVRAYERGMQLSGEGRTTQAKEELQRVLQLEPDPRNRYHVRAQDQINHILSVETQSLDHKLKSGLSALEDGDYSGALKYFDEVRDDKNHQERDLQQIRFAVARKNKQSKLLETAKDNLLRDRRERFIQLRDIFKLLTIWLPDGHPDKAEAHKHLQSVVDRLKNWKAGAYNRPR